LLGLEKQIWSFEKLVGQFRIRTKISIDNHHAQSMVIPYFPPHPNGEVISKWPRCSGTHMERQTQRGVRQKERRWLANAFFNERLPFRAISWRWLPNRKNTKKMRMYRPWGYIIQSSFSSFTGLKAVSIATAILNTAHRVIKITDPVVRPARN
jgi:hypothetical protein